MATQIAGGQVLEQCTCAIVLYFRNGCAGDATVGRLIDRQLKARVRVLPEMAAGLRTALRTTIETSGEIVEPQRRDLGKAVVAERRYPRRPLGLMDKILDFGDSPPIFWAENGRETAISGGCLHGLG